MKRSQVLLSVLGALMVIALFYVLLMQPSREELAVIEASILTEQAAQQELNVEIARLQGVREQAPEVEAQLAAADAIVPRDAALPSSLRQLQLAADESGIILQSVTTTRPAFLEGMTNGLSAIDVNLQVVGDYFQVVDFLRRIEDPAISARGLDWKNATVAVDEYPALNVALTGTIYAVLDLPVAPELETDGVDVTEDESGEEGVVEEDAPDEQTVTEDAA